MKNDNLQIYMEDNTSVIAAKVKSFDCIKKCDRLFFELVGEHGRSGKFKEIKDVKDFIRMEEHFQKKGMKGNCSMPSYLLHHNFHVIH